MTWSGFVRIAAGAAGLLVLGACAETPTSLPLRSLERSGEVAFVCAGTDGVGHDINACPDFESETNPRHLYALVTQTLRGEVAVVDLSAAKKVDIDPSTPGFNFLPVGANPVDIVATPGGVASFVGVAELGREGIFCDPDQLRPSTSAGSDILACLFIAVGAGRNGCGRGSAWPRRWRSCDATTGARELRRGLQCRCSDAWQRSGGDSRVVPSRSSLRKCASRKAEAGRRAARSRRRGDY